MKTLEDFRGMVYAEREDTLELLYDRLDELTEYERGRFKGEIMALDNVLAMLRKEIKYGDDD